MLISTLQGFFKILIQYAKELEIAKERLNALPEFVPQLLFTYLDKHQKGYVSITDISKLSKKVNVSPYFHHYSASRNNQLVQIQFVSSVIAQVHRKNDIFQNRQGGISKRVIQNFLNIVRGEQNLFKKMKIFENNVENIKKLFHEIDYNYSGYIHKEGLMAWYQNNHKSIQEREVKLIIQTIGVFNRNKCNFQEFSRFFTPITHFNQNESLKRTKSNHSFSKYFKSNYKVSSIRQAKSIKNHLSRIGTTIQFKKMSVQDLGINIQQWVDLIKKNIKKIKQQEMCIQDKKFSLVQMEDFDPITLFKVFDPDKKDSLIVSQIIDAFQCFQIKIDFIEGSLLIKQYNQAKTGKLSCRQFCKMFMPCKLRGTKFPFSNITMLQLYNFLKILVQKKKSIERCKQFLMLKKKINLEVVLEIVGQQQVQKWLGKPNPGIFQYLSPKLNKII